MNAAPRLPIPFPPAVRLRARPVAVVVLFALFFAATTVHALHDVVHANDVHGEVCVFFQAGGGTAVLASTPATIVAATAPSVAPTLARAHRPAVRAVAPHPIRGPPRTP